MDTRNRTQIPPPPPVAEPKPDRRQSYAPDHADGGWRPVIMMFLGLGAWAAGFVLWVSAEDADVPTKNYFGSVALAVVGATLLIVAALYELVGRDR